MGTSDPQPKKLLDLDKPGNGNRHPLLSVSIVEEVLQSVAPELLDDPERSNPLLDKIYHYLFGQHRLRDPALRDLLSDELYTTLYGLKILLKGHNVNVVELCLEEHKRQFGRWIDAELDED